ncbi:hypothetical protein ACJX0J_027373, partial [Zea mays]
MCYVKEKPRKKLRYSSLRKKQAHDWSPDSHMLLVQNLQGAPEFSFCETFSAGVNEVNLIVCFLTCCAHSFVGTGWAYYMYTTLYVVPWLREGVHEPGGIIIQICSNQGLIFQELGLITARTNCVALIPIGVGNLEAGVVWSVET